MRNLLLPLLFTLLVAIHAVSAATYVRVLHASPGAPPVDVYIDGSRAFTNVQFGQFSVNYISVTSGSHNVKVWPSGATSGTGTPLVNQDISTSDNAFYTVAIVGTVAGTGNNALGAVVYQDESGQAGVARVRVLQLSPDAPSIMMTVRGNESAALFTNINYRNAGNYVSVPPGTYAYDFRSMSNTSVILLSTNASTFAANLAYSIAILGNTNGNPPQLSSVTLIDGTVPPTQTQTGTQSQSPTQTNTPTATESAANRFDALSYGIVVGIFTTLTSVVLLVL